MKPLFLGPALVILTAAACSSGANDASLTPGLPAPTVAAPVAQPTTVSQEPVRKTYARGETVDIPRGTLFLDPRTGGGEAWADVAVSPLGLFAPWNGSNGKGPPVLYETLTRRRIELDTGGRFGQVLNFSPDETEVSVRAGDEVLIASTNDGKPRLALPLVPAATFARAFWGPEGAVAVTSAGAQVRRGANLRAFRSGHGAGSRPSRRSQPSTGSTGRLMAAAS